MPQSGATIGTQRDVIVIGGGFAGWLSAIAILAAQQEIRAKTGLDGRVIVIRAPEVPPIGVGESSTGLLPTFLRNMRIDWRAFVRASRATFKLGACYDGWNGPGGHYWSPIDNPDVMMGLSSSAGTSICQRAAVADGEHLHKAHLHGWLMPLDRVPAIRHQDQTEWVPSASWHFDAGRAAGYVEQVALSRGALLVEATIGAIERDEDGSIAALCLADGRKVCGGFHLDCSGQRRLLSDGSDWRDLASRILVSAAVAGFVPHRSRLQTYTRATAARNGWMWEIPTQDRLGVGYVYAADALTPDEARRELERYYGTTITRGPTLRFAPGYRTRSWTKNSAAVGLAAGFFEPLESTSIHLALVQMQILAQALVVAGGAKNLALQHAQEERYNGWMSLVQEDIADFIQLHYAASTDPSPFWRAAVTAGQNTELYAVTKVGSGGFPDDRSLRGRSDLLSPNLVLPALAGLGLLSRPPAEEASAAARRMRALHRDFSAQALTHERALKLICPDFSFREVTASQATISQEKASERV